MPFDEHESYFSRGLLQGPGILDGRINLRKLMQRGFYLEARGPVQAAASQGGAVAGTTGAVNILSFANGVMLEHNVLGAGQTIKVPVPGTLGGMNIAQDLTDNEGAEYTNGIIAGGPSAFVVGTDPAFYTKAKLNIPDVSGSDQIFVGFRKVQAYATAYTSYTDMALLGNISGAVKTVTNLANAGAVTTDTTDTWADGATHTLEVRVSAAGVVTYLFDGRAPAAVVAYTFAAASVVPCLWFLHDSDLAQATELLSWEAGFQVPASY